MVCQAAVSYTHLDVYKRQLERLSVTVVPATQGGRNSYQRASPLRKQINWQPGSVLKVFMRRSGGYINVSYCMPKACAVRVTV